MFHYIEKSYLDQPLLGFAYGFFAFDTSFLQIPSRQSELSFVKQIPEIAFEHGAFGNILSFLRTLVEAAAADAKDEPRLGNVATVIVKALREPLSLPDNATIMGFLSDGDELRSEFRVGEMAEIISKTREARRELVQQKKRFDRRLGPITRSVTVLEQILDVFDDSEKVNSEEDEDHQG